MKTRNAKPPRKTSKWRLFYLQVGGLLPVQVILYFAQHTEAEGGFQEVDIFGTLAGLNFVEQGLQTLLLCRGIEVKNLEES